MRSELAGHEANGTFSGDEVPEKINVITAKWVFTWKTDAEGLITKAKARLVARGFGQRFGVDYFETFAPTPSVSSIKVAIAIAVQNGWPLYHLDVQQAFVRAPLDTDVYMKLPAGCGKRTGDVVKLNKALYGVKQAGRQWSSHLCKILVRYLDMEQCKADPCVFRRIVDGVVVLILVVHVDDILVGGKKDACDELHSILNQKFPTTNLGEVHWYMGCAVERDWEENSIKLSQETFVRTLLKRFGVIHRESTPASPTADLGPTLESDLVVDRPFRQAVGGLMWLAGMSRPDIADAVRAVARHSHDPCERHWKAVMRIMGYLHETPDIGITYKKGKELSLSVYADANYASKATDRRSISGVAVMLGGAAVYATSRTQHCVTLSTTEAEYVAMAEGAKEGLFVRAVMSFMQPKSDTVGIDTYVIQILEDNEGAKAMAENPLSSGRSKHIDVRWHFIRELVESGEVKIVHVGTEEQHADMLTKALDVKLFKRHRAALMNL